MSLEKCLWKDVFEDNKELYVLNEKKLNSFGDISDWFKYGCPKCDGYNMNCKIYQQQMVIKK